MEFLLIKQRNTRDYTILNQHFEKNNRGKIMYANYLCKSLHDVDNYYIISTLGVISYYSFLNQYESLKDFKHQFFFDNYDKCFEVFKKYNTFLHTRQLIRNSLKDIEIASFYLSEPFFKFVSSNKNWHGEQPKILSKRSIDSERNRYLLLNLDVNCVLTYMSDDLQEQIEKGDVIKLSQKEFFDALQTDMTLFDFVLDNYQLILAVDKDDLEFYLFREDEFDRLIIYKNHFNDSELIMAININNPPKKEDVLKLFQQ